MSDHVKLTLNIITTIAQIAPQSFMMKDSDELTPAHYATMNGHLDIIKILFLLLLYLKLSHIIF